MRKVVGLIVFTAAFYQAQAWGRDLTDDWTDDWPTATVAADQKKYEVCEAANPTGPALSVRTLPEGSQNIFKIPNGTKVSIQDHWMTTWVFVVGFEVTNKQIRFIGAGWVRYGYLIHCHKS